MNGTETGRERTAMVEERSAGLSVAQIMLVAVLLAAGAVMKFFIGSIFSAGMKPNFIIAMYCLAILLVRPRFKEAAIIGLLAGAVCQFFPGTPYLNFPSELAGALVMALFARMDGRAGGGFDLRHDGGERRRLHGAALRALLLRRHDGPRAARGLRGDNLRHRRRKQHNRTGALHTGLRRPQNARGGKIGTAPDDLRRKPLIHL